jgi:hypothetical protein
MLLSIPIAAGGLAIVLGAIALLVFRVAQHTAMFKSRSLNSIASARFSFLWNSDLKATFVRQFERERS